MKDALTQKSVGYMPREIAVTLLTSPQSKTAGFRKRCYRAMERVVEPVSRSTRFNISAPKTGAQRLAARLKRATAAQLHKWHRRALRRGNNLMDIRDKVAFNSHNPEGDSEVATMLERLSKQIAAHDSFCEAITAELDFRRQRGKISTP